MRNTEWGDIMTDNTSKAAAASPSPQLHGEKRGAQDMSEQLDRKADGPVQNGQKSASSNAKDPLRPRRKKAKRACFACQRAHLTCGMYCIYLHILVLTWRRIIRLINVRINR